jgi:hypothetical protein
LVQEKSTASLGRVLVAAKDFRPGEHVLTEAPLYSGPKGSDTKLVCLGCYVDMDAITGNACSSCRWPLCPDCKEVSLMPELKWALLRVFYYMVAYIYMYFNPYVFRIQRN